MSDGLLSVSQASERLGIRPATLYDWLSRSDYGLFVIRGERVDVRYFQSGPAGQGRIRLEAAEVERIRELMRVPMRIRVARRPRLAPHNFPGITAPLGRPPEA